MKRPRTFQVGVCVENASKHSIVVDLIVMQNVQLPINQTQPRPLGPPPPFPGHNIALHRFQNLFDCSLADQVCIVFIVIVHLL